MTDRMFAAVLLPDEARDTLDRVVDPRRDDEWRWTRPESWHITLAFYASVEPWRRDLLMEHLAEAATRTPAFPAGIEGVGCFPSAEKAKVLYAAADDPTGSLPPLAGRCRTAATTAGIELRSERYIPHVTLARSSYPKQATRWLKALVALSAEQWQVAEIALVQSLLGQGRPRYEVCQRFVLGAVRDA